MACRQDSPVDLTRLPSVLRPGVAAAGVLLLLLAGCREARAEETSVPAAAEAPGAVEVADADADAESEVARAESTRSDTAGDAVDDSIRETFAKEPARFDLLGWRGRAVRSWRASVERRYGLSFGLAYTVLYQGAERGHGPLDAAVGDLDLFGRWRAFGTENRDAGILHVYTEWRHLLGTDIAPFNLSKSLGTLNETTTGFTKQPYALTQLYWEQAWDCGRWTARLGKMDPAVFFFGNRLNNVNTWFVGFPFSDCPAVFFPGAALGANLTFRFDDSWSLGAGVQDANGEKLGDAFETIREGEFWWAGQVQYTRCTPRLGVGHARVGAWYAEAREKAQKPGGGGFALSLDQELGRPGAVGFLRYEVQTDPLESARQGVGFARQGLVPSRQALRVGAVLEGLVRRRAWREDAFGFGASWSDPYDERLRDEYLLETFWRFQLGPDIQLTPSYQLFIDPADNPGASTIGVFSLRFRLLL